MLRKPKMYGVNKPISHYLQRTRELGLAGVIQRAWVRITGFLSLQIQSIWWGWMASHTMRDASLLARTTGEWRSVDELLDHLLKRPSSSFLLPHGSTTTAHQFLKESYSAYVSNMLDKADAICRNEIELFGKTFYYPQYIDWHRDPASGWRWPLKHRSGMSRYLYSEIIQADPILLWELNRHQHFITLGIAYWLTGDQKYAGAFISHINNWIETNPLQHGVNWYYPLEISIRLLAWTTAFQFFRSSPEFRERAGKSFLISLWQQADFLSRHLQNTREDVPNNHMISELAGMILVGTVFPEFSKAREWREKGLQLLTQQVTAQTHSDGVNKEQATGYHRFVVELLTLVVMQSRHGNLPPIPEIENMLAKMLDYIGYNLTPDGAAPQWGDSDYGRALGLGGKKDFWDFRPALSVGAVLYARPDWKFMAGCFDEEAFLLLGIEGVNMWGKIEACMPEKTSCGFPVAGQYVLRDSWTSDTDVAFFRCGPYGLGGEGHCAHAHNDLLSLVLWINGKPALVDAGTYTYHGALRDYFRLTAAHNTVMVDALEQAAPVPNFNWRRIPEARCIEWSKNRVVGSLSYPNQVEFIREVNHPAKKTWEITDNFWGDDGFHEITWFYHFAAGLDLRQDESGGHVIAEANSVPCFWVMAPGNDVRVEFVSGWVSRDYGKKEANSILRATWIGKIPSDGISFFWKFSGVHKKDKR